jgi:hypothetical protein
MRLENIKAIIAKGKITIEELKPLVSEYLLKQDKAKFDADMRAEYDELFPAYRDMTDEEIEEKYQAYLSEYPKDITKDKYVTSHNSYLTVEIDYSEDEDYVTFNEWINETEVVTPAVEEVLDTDGTVITPAVPEVTRRIREFVAGDYTAQVDEFITNSPEIKAREKVKIQDIINKSTVTTAAGNVFDANLESRVNMADAILASETLGQTETVWRLADNSEITVDIAELREAHALALQSYAQIKAIGTLK